jgi:hypothetical protein
VQRAVGHGLQLVEAWRIAGNLHDAGVGCAAVLQVRIPGIEDSYAMHHEVVLINLRVNRAYSGAPDAGVISGHLLRSSEQQSHLKCLGSPQAEDDGSIRMDLRRHQARRSAAARMISVFGTRRILRGKKAYEGDRDEVLHGCPK